eukprot:g42952.t1
MKEEMDRAQAELDALKRTEEDLKKGHQKLEMMVSNLDQEMADVEKNIEVLRKKDDELSIALEKMESQSENNDIDEVVVPTAPLYKQILNLYAEENAIEDTIFYLGEALRRDVIDLEVFLKQMELTMILAELSHYRAQITCYSNSLPAPPLSLVSVIVLLKPHHVRLLSRKQFQLRALMQKARKTAGL